MPESAVDVLEGDRSSLATASAVPDANGGLKRIESPYAHILKRRSSDKGGARIHGVEVQHGVKVFARRLPRSDQDGQPGEAAGVLSKFWKIDRQRALVRACQPLFKQILTNG